MQGEYVISCEHVALLAEQKRSILWSQTRRPMPAAAILNWQASQIINQIKNKRFTIYTKKQKKCQTKS